MSGDTPAGTPPEPPRDAVLVFVRAPELGRVKTRLAADIGAEAALRVYRRLAEQAVGEALRLGDGVEVRVHFTPDDAGGAVREWLGPGPTLLPQPAGDLGARMESAFDAAFRAGHRRVAIIGSDLPGIRASLLRDALDLLARHPVAVGPAADGGYYLLALREPRPELFRDVPWSTDRVLDCTLHKLGAAGIAPALLPTLRDVDTAADLPPEFVAGP